MKGREGRGTGGGEIHAPCELGRDKGALRSAATPAGRALDCNGFLKVPLLFKERHKNLLSAGDASELFRSNLGLALKFLS